MAGRVQVLSTFGLDHLPDQFIRPAHEQPENTKPAEGVGVPKISLDQPADILIEEISKACKEWGFFIITDHGLPMDLISRLQDVGEHFFRLPQEEKERYANDPASGKMEGYGTRMTKNLDQKVEWVDYFFHLLWPPTTVNYQVWPTNPLSYRETNEEYGKEEIKLVGRLLEYLSMGLGLKKEALRTSLGGDGLELEMKINLYPPCPQPELALGVEAHTDMCGLTVLVPNDVPGLQIWKDGNWVAIEYVPNALYIHASDQLEILSNGRYKSVLHRSLVHKDRQRMSWAVFCVPPLDTVIGPLPELVSDQDPPKYNTKTYKEYQYRKFNKLPQ